MTSHWEFEEHVRKEYYIIFGYADHSRCGKKSTRPEKKATLNNDFYKKKSTGSARPAKGYRG